MYKTIEIDDALKNKLFGSMDLVVQDVFNNYFGVSVKVNNSYDATESATDRKNCLCEVKMEQTGIDIFLCFDFDAELLFRLVDETYAGEVINDLAPYNDAACEIANIVCCRIKSILNGNGYKFDMSIPKSIDNNDKFNGVPYTLNMRFSDASGSGLFVSLFTLKQG